MTATCIMVLGTTSGAGKSWLTTALCRHYARQGLKVAPFKAQNMSNNARVVASSNGQGEIGSAQYFQALAAKAVPDVRMNPLLLKPEADTHSQVVLMGQVNDELTAMPWRGRSLKVWPQIAAALDALCAENDVVVIEGAGSPAEINLHDSDIVNMRVALHCNAACLLVTDIDRGGAFAHLYGTWALLPPGERALIKGFVLNKFRGDASLLAPAPQMLQDLTGIPTIATLPMWWQHGLPEEDGVFDDRSISKGAVNLTVAVIAYPRISNLDEFQPLKNIPGVRLMWVRSPSELASLNVTDWIVLPGSKSTSADLAWLRAQGLDAAVARHAGHGGAVLGVCGGLQMLGEALIDPHGIDGNAPGLGLLPLVTVFEANKTVCHTRVSFAAEAVLPVADDVGRACASGHRAGGLILPNAQKSAPGPMPTDAGQWIGERSNCWDSLAGVSVSGYEIHHGQTAQHPDMARAGDVAREVLPGGLGWQNAAGNVLGIYLHGLFEDSAALQALFGARLNAPVPTLETVFERMADFIETNFEPNALQALLQS
ncbi:cobyric acid synthase [Rhodoferax sp.]|uniref:cobyric acid synthase n=1 Tax=Rhodoferax sp. TaxID=50421 RepID=UPI00284D2097|nr:cobyric acid synthase [Rhodoferax sp.]MDR3370299.1 cobyric acid synthase [Rhodoferax sp.]